MRFTNKMTEKNVNLSTFSS